MGLPTKLKSIPLYEEKYDRKALINALGRMSQRNFDRGMRQIALSDEDRLFPSYPACRVRGLNLQNLRTMPWPTLFGVDLSGQKRKGNAIVAAKVDPGSLRRYVIDVRHGAWKSTQTADHIATMYSAYGALAIMVENNGYQQSLIDWAMALGAKGGNDYWMKLEPLTTTGQKKSNEELGVSGLEIEFKNSAWSFPWDEWASHEIGCHCSWCEMDRQLRDYPFGAATDIPMALWFTKVGIDTYVRQIRDTAQVMAGLGNLRRR